jgi:hypothetical protein
MRARALTGQRHAWVVALWLICSPWTAFFWSANVRVTRTRRVTSKSFKEASAAAKVPVAVAVWKVMSPRVKAWERPVLAEYRYSAGRRMIQKKPTVQRSQTWDQASGERVSG